MGHLGLRLEVMSLCEDGGLCALARDNAKPCKLGESNCVDPPPSNQKPHASWTEVAIPNNAWQKFAFGSLLLSIFVAMAINFYSPDDYRALHIRDPWVVLIASVIPTAQVLAVVVASLTVQKLLVHSLATLTYLSLFVFWDLIIILAKPTKERPEGGKADQLVKRAKEYLARIDLPVALTFLLLFVGASFVPKESPEPFVAGILSSQACAAAFGLVIVLIDEFKRFKQDRSPNAESSETAPEPILP